MKDLITLSELSELFDMTNQGLSYRLRLLKHAHVKKVMNTLYFNKEVIQLLKDFKPKSRIIKKESIEIGHEVIYVTQTFHIYESKLNYMI